MKHLSRREAEVLSMTFDGRTNAEIAQALYISPSTVKTYFKLVNEKTGFGGLRGIIAALIKDGYLTWTKPLYEEKR